ncbi:MAG: siderophore-interacting protein [Actinopolymorphaceae bacterium]
MARTSNLETARVKPAKSQLLTLHVLRRERISPTFVRVTLGGGDIEHFVAMGFDQWFRLFIPVSQDQRGVLSRLPQKLDTVSYLKYLKIAKATRPVLRNYTVRAYRADGAEGPELDVDFVLHGSAADGTAGPAASWAETCSVGDAVAILDEGIGFNPPASLRRVLLVADETALPAVAGILGSLPRDAVGQALVEMPTAADRQDVDAPAEVDVTWVVREDADAVPGRAVLAAAEALPLPADPFYGWVAGEHALPTTLRRHWVSSGVSKQNIVLCGYWKHGQTH